MIGNGNDCNEYDDFSRFVLNLLAEKINMAMYSVEYSEMKARDW